MSRYLLLLGLSARLSPLEAISVHPPCRVTSIEHRRRGHSAGVEGEMGSRRKSCLKLLKGVVFIRDNLSGMWQTFSGTWSC